MPSAAKQAPDPETTTPPDYSPHPSLFELAPQRALEDMPGDIVRAKNVTDAVALTFDAGADAAPAASILDTLKSQNLQVTFFLTGKWCQDNPELVKRIVAEGHEVGNHSYSHPDLRNLTDQAIADQLAKMNRVFNEITGASCIGLMRPPYGSLDKRVISVTEEAGYGSVRWSVDSWDAWKEGITGQEIEDRVLHRVKPGDIVLMHCGSKPTADVLPVLIKKLNSRGLRVVTISELVGAKEIEQETEAE